MVKYAFVKDGQIIDLVDELPPKWRTTVNLHLADKDHLESLGWYEIKHISKELQSENEYYGECKYWFEGGNVFAEAETFEKTDEQIKAEAEEESRKREREELDKWKRIRIERDRLMNEISWRYERYHREVRMGLTPSDDIKILDEYMQQLADIPNTFKLADEVVFPVIED
jgi:hypothetical protein